jgi:hypothetical protein
MVVMFESRGGEFVKSYIENKYNGSPVSHEVWIGMGKFEIKLVLLRWQFSPIPVG